MKQLKGEILSQEEGFYFAFVDIEKSFEQVPKDILWWALRDIVWSALRKLMKIS